VKTDLYRRELLASAVAVALPAVPIAPAISALEMRKAAELYAGARECIFWWDRAEYYAFMDVWRPGWRELIAAAGYVLPDD
jgi:hypothetical protein